MEAAAIASAPSLLSKLGSPSTLDFLCKWGLDRSLLEELQLHHNSVHRLLDNAENRHHENIHEITTWLQYARSAIYDGEDLLDHIFTDIDEVCNKLGDSPNIYEIVKEKLTYKWGDFKKTIVPWKQTREAEMKVIITRLKNLENQKDALGLKESDVTPLRTSETTSLERLFVGRRNDLEMIKSLLSGREKNSNNIRVISIVGMPGLGKTALARKIFNVLDPEFKLTGWVCVSNEFDVKKILKSLLENITGKNSSSADNLELIEKELEEKLKGKKFLLVLDDIWSDKPNDWNELQNVFKVGAPRSKIIVTTRTITVARVMTNEIDKYELHVMSDDDCWALFQSIVFSNAESNTILEEIGREAIQKCKGVPLAVQMLGGLLKSASTDEIKWKNVLTSKVWDLNRTTILPELWLSYYRLPVEVKQCFAYCSIFPKDYLFSKNEMIDLWVAEGMIYAKELSSGIQCQDVARGCFEHLQSNFFFQSSEDGFLMHDLVHDLAEHVSRGICVALDNVADQSRRLSYIQGRHEDIPNFSSVKKLSHIRTFLPIKTDDTTFVYPNLFNSLLLNFRLLRVLSLKGYRIGKFPSSIKYMKLLRYLNMSDTNIEYVPDWLCDLYNLQTLILTSCIDLKRLPSNLSNLVNLQNLHFDDCHYLKKIDCLEKMTNLYSLSNFILSKKNPRALRGLKELSRLHGTLRVERLDRVKETSDIVTDILRNKEHLEKIHLEWKRKIEIEVDLDSQVLDALQPHTNLKELTISGYRGSNLPDWIVGAGTSFSKITSLRIISCSHCRYLPSLGNMPCLEYLEIFGLCNLQSLGDEFRGDSNYPFSSLKKLEIKWCYELTTISYCFPTLVELTITSCGKLRNLEVCEILKTTSSPIRHSLQSIVIRNCNSLREIPKSFDNLSNVDIEKCRELVSVPTLQHVSYLTLLSVGDKFPIAKTTLDCTTHLERLDISGSVNALELFNVEMVPLPNLTSLKWLIFSLENIQVQVDLPLEKMEVQVNLPSLSSSPTPGLVKLPPNLLCLNINGNGSAINICCDILWRLDYHKYLTH